MSIINREGIARLRAVLLLSLVVAGTAVAILFLYKEPVTIATSRAFGSLPVWVAYEEGMFGRQGLSPNLREFPVALLANQALQEGQVDFIGAEPRSVFQYSLQTGRILKLVHVTANILPGNTQLVIRNGLNITSLEDLRNRTLAFDDLSLACLECFAFRLLLNQTGIVVNIDVNVTQIAYQRMSDSLSVGLIDAAVMTEPYNSLAVLDGIGYVLNDPRLGEAGDASVKVLGSQTSVDGTTLRGWLATSAFWTTETFLTSRPETAHKFARAIAEAGSWLMNGQNIARAAAIAVKYVGGLGSPQLFDYAARSVVQTYFWKSYADGFLEWPALQYQVDLMVENGVLDSSIDVKRFVSLPWFTPT